MNQETRATLEIIAPSVDEAVEQGLAELGLNAKMLISKYSMKAKAACSALADGNPACV